MGFTKFRTSYECDCLVHTPPYGFFFLSAGEAMNISFAYLAGLIDGEGCFHTSVDYQKCGKANTPNLSISNTNKNVLLWAKTICGGSVQQHKKRNETCKILYELTIRSNQAIAITKLLLPYLKIKKEQAEIFILFEHINKTAETCPKKRNILRQELSDKLKFLKNQ